MKETLINLREYKKLSIFQISKLIGVSEDRYKKYEAGEAVPNMRTIQIIANYFNVPPKAIINNEYKYGYKEELEELPIATDQMLKEILEKKRMNARVNKKEKLQKVYNLILKLDREEQISLIYYIATLIQLNSPE